jgi:formylglycine-generating enzyme required for sulfatase activity
MKCVTAAGALGGIVGLAALLFIAIEPEAGLAKAQVGSATVPGNCQDLDRDGYGINCPKGPDCNDRDPSVSPAHKEICNMRDDDCNGLVDDNANCPSVAYNPQPVDVAASTLWMGSGPDQGAKDEHPQHLVELSAFSLDRYEVTNERYAACVKAGACKAPQLPSSAKRKTYFGAAEFARYPVVFVGWAEANQFCHWDGGRLPTEAEWELSARGPSPSKRIFPWGDEAPDCTKANMGGDGSCVSDTDLVGRRTWGASPWGALDLAGNVWEWTADWYDANYYQNSPRRDPQGPSQGRLKVMRGGCWMSGADSLRVSCRKAEMPETWAPNVGFRCVRSRAR